MKNSKKLPKFLPNPHDAFFREVFSRKEEVKDFLRVVLPTALSEDLNFDSLTLDNTSYLNENLKTQFSDMVYSASYQAKQAVKLSFLLEHKSAYSPQTPIHIQLLRYMLGIWDQQEKQGKPLCPIIPILVYHGKENWRARSLSQYFQEKYDLAPTSPLLLYVPDLNYILSDLNTYSDSEIKSLFSLLSLQTALFTLKKIFQNDLEKELKKLTEEIKSLVQTESGRDFYRKILLYLYYGSHSKKDKIIKIMSDISQEAGKAALSTAEQLIQEGMEKGVQEGIQINLYQNIVKLIESGALPLSEIARILEVPLADVQRIAQELQNPD